MQKPRKGLLLFLGITMGGALAWMQGAMALRDDDPSGEIAYQEMITLAQVMRRIRDSYVEEVDDQELLKSAISGMLEGLDPHSAYLDEDAFADVNISTSGKFGGLGIEVTQQNGFIKVVSPIDDTPAMKAGVLPGDLIVRLDDKPVKGMSLGDAVELMRGEPGTIIKLTILREGADAPLSIDIERAIIKIKSVKSRILEPGYGYIRITQFQNDSGPAVANAVQKLMADSKLKGLVLDMRNNPGGVLNASVEVSEVFLDAGLVVYIQGRNADSRRDYEAKAGDALNGAPLVVLVNEGSASASEIVAGALQDRRRAIVMGRQTFGKGSVQSIIPLRENAAIKLTTARYYTPEGRSIQGEGIKPDIVLERVQVSALEQNSDVTPLKERDLSRSLANENGKADKDDMPAKALAQTDYGLYEALNLLKGLHILQANSRK